MAAPGEMTQFTPTPQKLTKNASNSSKKRKILTLEDRMKVVERSERGESARKVAAVMGVGKTQVQSIILNKENVRSAWTSGIGVERKYLKARRCLYADINEVLYMHVLFISFSVNTRTCIERPPVI